MLLAVFKPHLFSEQGFKQLYLKCHIWTFWCDWILFHLITTSNFAQAHQPETKIKKTFKNKNKLDQYILIQQHLHLDQITKRRFCRHWKTPFSTANTTIKFLLTSFTSPLILFSVSSRSFACSRCKASKRFYKSIPRNLRNSASIKWPLHY